MNDLNPPCRVLLVHDEPQLLQYHSEILQSAGMTVMVETDPLRVADLLQSFTADALLLDLDMTACSAMELAASLRSNPAFAYLPILLLSAEGGLEKQVQALTVGADDFLSKPVETSLLVSTIRARTQRWRSHIELTAARQKSEEKLRISEARLQEAQRMARIGSWELDLVSNRLYWSDEIFRIFEIDPAHFGASYAAFLDLVHPEDKNLVNAAYTRSLETRQPYDITHRLLMKDGRVKFVHEHCVTTFDGNDKPLASWGTAYEPNDQAWPNQYGKPLVSKGTVQDITELKKVELSLAESEKRLLTILESVDACIYIKDIHYRYQFANRPVRQLFGLETADIIEAEDNRFFDAATAAQLRENDRRVIENGETIRLEETNTVSATGDTCTYWTVKLPLYNEAGQIQGLCGISTDITERKQAELSLNKLNEELEQRVQLRTAALQCAKEEAERANQAKTEFLSRMSHELRTPMNSILGYTQLLEADSSLLPEQREDIKIISNSGWHLLDLINDLLDFSSIESGRLALMIETVVAQEVVADCLATIAPLASKHKVTIHPPASPCPCLVSADRVRLRQVLTNLLTNAIKYNKEGGSVRVDCHPSGDGHNHIEVSDTGIGIREEDMALLFEPFSRLYLETYAIEGSGIGLALSRRLTEAMGGSLHVSSSVGTGSTFTIKLPLSLEAPLAPAALTATAKVLTGKALALYIEDSPAHIRLVQDILARWPNLGLIATHSPELGVELAACHLPEVILLDINLPGMNGFEVLRLLRANPVTKNIPVIALSADALKQSIKRGLDDGFFDYLTKPLQIQKFMNAITQAIGKDLLTS